METDNLSVNLTIKWNRIMRFVKHKISQVLETLK